MVKWRSARLGRAFRLLDQHDALPHLNGANHGRVRARTALNHEEHCGHLVALCKRGL